MRISIKEGSSSLREKEKYNVYCQKDFFCLDGYEMNNGKRTIYV